MYKMHSLTQLSLEDLKAYSKYAQFHSMIDTSELTNGSMIQRAKRLMKKEGDINFKIPSDSLVCSKNIKGGTLLHIASLFHSTEISNYLLNLGAEFTIKSESGCTAIHCAFNMCFMESKKFSKYKDNLHLNLLLSAHVKFANPSNPCDNDGLSHLHIACIANNVKVVEFFLKNKVDINHTVYNEKNTYNGFTPLHFAILHCSLETIEILLKYGVDKTIKNGCGLIPLHQLINQRIELLESTIRYTRVESVESIRKTLEDEANLSEKIIFMILGSNFLDKVDIVDSTGLSTFHIACMLSDSSIVESLLEQVKDINHCVKADLSICPGYTALHFAAHCNINTMNLLQKRGANIHIKDAEGHTPFDICIQRGIVEDIHSTLLLIPEWANVLFSDNKTRLISFISVMRDKFLLSNFLCNCVDDINMALPKNFALWPGFTPLHLAVSISKKYRESISSSQSSNIQSNLEQIEEILIFGADVTKKDANGNTPLHHAFRQGKKKVSDLLRKHHHSFENPVDEDNLSHLHIACTAFDKKLVEKILSSNTVDVNIPYKGKQEVQDIKPGWLPLNIVGCHKEFKTMLQQRGAKVVNRYGTSVLHSACEKDDKDEVEQLLENGADINLKLDDGCTPLLVALRSSSPEIIQLLLQRGADLLAKDDRGFSPLTWMIILSNSTYKHSIAFVLKQNKELQKRMEKEIGITMLHIACYTLDIEEVRSQLDRGARVDAQVPKDSKCWPGFTALHVLMSLVQKRFSKDEISELIINDITELLLKNGTDVTLTNAYNDTPVHISHYSEREDSVSRIKLLLKHHRDFRINPVNSEGLSHFHLTVMLDIVELIEKFLEHGVNINQPPDFFADNYGGYTPLHMAIDNVKRLSKLETVDLLLSHGADVNLEDVDGRSALCKAIFEGLGSLRIRLMEKLLSYGADMNSEDIFGITPFELLLSSEDASVEDIRLVLKHGCLVNRSNYVTDRGYLGIILSHEDEERRNLLFLELMKAPDIATVNELGRSIIHNVVATTEPTISVEEYVTLFMVFKKFGCDIDDPDRTGLTALHLAAQFGNENAISALLNMGADLNVVDSKGKSALSYAIEVCVNCEEDLTKHYHEDVIEALVIQVYKLQFFHLNVSQLNIDLLPKCFDIMEYEDIYLGEEIELEADQAMRFKFTPLSLTMHSFLSGTVNYCYMSEFSRDVIDKTIESIDFRLRQIRPILKLQYRKALTKFQRLQTVPYLNLLVGFAFPDLCSEIVLSFLCNRDLKNIVAATNLVN